MKTKKLKIQDVAERSGIPNKLIRAVVRQLGGMEYAVEAFHDMMQPCCGISGGFGGFIYHSDTEAFYKRNRKEINPLVERRAEDFGEDPQAMVAGFNCLKPADKDTRLSIYKCMCGARLNSSSDTIVANALAWFAGEEVAWAWVDAEYELEHE